MSLRAQAACQAAGREAIAAAPSGHVERGFERGDELAGGLGEKAKEHGGVRNRRCEHPAGEFGRIGGVKGDGGAAAAEEAAARWAAPRAVRARARKMRE